MTPTTAFLVGALVGALIVLLIAWFIWGRKIGELNGALEASRQEVTGLKAEKVRLEGEANVTKTAMAQLEEQKTFLAGEKARLEGERAQAEAVALKNQSERSHLEGTVSRLQVEKSEFSAEVDRVSFENQKLRARLGELEEALQNAGSAAQDDFTELKGVDPALAYRLKLSGIQKFSDLGQLSPRRLQELAGVEDAKIVTAARSKAGLKVDDLEVIVGIGPVIARELNQAGIFTFAELAKLTADQLRAILGDKIQRLADEDDLLNQARKLAEQA